MTDTTASSTRARAARPAVLGLAALTLVTVAGAGGAVAAGMVTSAGIKDNTIASRDVRDGSLTMKDFSKKTRTEVSKPGPAGPQGPVGPRGYQGEQGEQGPQGEPGLPGLDGLDGLDGVDGLPGLPGADGTDGADGAPGLPGLDGLPGADGADGTDGADGVSGLETVTKAASVAGLLTDTVTATCPSGKVPVAGGFEANGLLNALSLLGSHPTETGWSATFANGLVGSQPVSVYVVCALAS